jgi:uncharacterized membrane-anchored protein YhcB (DUF1043 family)
MNLTYSAFSTEFAVAFKGALTHEVTLGTDIHGNITRIDNVLNGMESARQHCEESLAETKARLETAKSEMETPFAREQELTDKTAKLAELTIALKLNEKDHEILDGAPDEGDTEQDERKKPKEYER